MRIGDWPIGGVEFTGARDGRWRDSLWWRRVFFFPFSFDLFWILGLFHSIFKFFFVHFMVSFCDFFLVFKIYSAVFYFQNQGVLSNDNEIGGSIE